MANRPVSTHCFPSAGGWRHTSRTTAIARGKRPLEDGQLVATVPTALPRKAHYDEWLTRQGRDLIGYIPEDGPWFVQVTLQNPLDPSDVNRGMCERFRDPPVEFSSPVTSSREVPAETHYELPRSYTAMAKQLNRCLDRLVETVERRGVLGDTMAMFISDHNKILDDHGHW